MKVFTSTIDIALPSPKRFWVAPHSDFKIGVKIVKNGVPVENEFTVKAGSTALTPDDGKVDGFTTYTISSGATGFVEYDVEVAGAVQKQKILQIVTDSTVFEVGGEGGSGDLSQYAKKTWVEEQISSFVTEDALSDFITAEDLTAYATKAETDALLSAKADKVKQLPADQSVWETTGWNAVSSSDEEGDVKGAPYTKITTGFYDISEYCDYEVSAQYISPNWTNRETPAWKNRGRINLLSECTNGKTVFLRVYQSEDNTDVFDDPSEWTGQISGELSVYFELAADKIPDNGRSIQESGMTLSDWEAMDELASSTKKTVAYVSQNMDQSAPFVLRDLTEYDVVYPIPDQYICHSAIEHVIPGFIEVSAVYGDEISSFVGGQQLDEILNDRLANYVDWDSMGNYPTYDDLTAYATVDSLSDYATYDALSGVNDTAVSALSKAEDAWSSAEAAMGAVASKVDHTPGGLAPEVLEIVTYYTSEYTQLSVDDPTWEPNENTMYVILPDPA